MEVRKKPEVEIRYIRLDENNNISEEASLDWANLTYSNNDDCKVELSFDTNYYIDQTQEGWDMIAFTSYDGVNNNCISDYLFIDRIDVNNESNVYTLTCINQAYRLLSTNEFYKVYNDTSYYDIIKDIVKDLNLIEQGLYGIPNIHDKISTIFDGQTGLEIIYGCIYNLEIPVRIFLFQDVLNFSIIENWHSDYFFVPEELISENVTFDSSKIITDVLALPSGNPLLTTNTTQSSDNFGKPTTYSSEQIYGIKLSKYFPIYQKVIGTLNTSGLSKLSGIDNFDSDGVSNSKQQVIGIGRPSTCSDGSDYNRCGVNIFQNFCPRCERQGKLVFHSSFHHRPGKTDVEGEITCAEELGGCGADYSIFGNEKSYCGAPWKLNLVSESFDDCANISTLQKDISEGKYIDKGTEAKEATDTSPAQPYKPPQKESVNSDIESELRTALNTIGDSLNDLLQITLVIPGDNVNLSPNRFVNVTLPDNFKLDGLEKILQPISKKFPYKDEITFYNNWFFCRDKKTTINFDKYETQVTLTPLPPSHSQYRKLLLKAKDNYANAKISAENSNKTALNNVDLGDPVLGTILRGLADKYASQCNTAWPQGCSTGNYSMGLDCWGMSEVLYEGLINKGYHSRIVQYPYEGGAYNHRSVQIKTNKGWASYPYREYGFNEGFYNDNNNEWNNYTVYKE